MQERAASNLTELWWDAEKRAVLTVNGFSDRGSDYEIFRDFCTCLSRMPNSVEMARSREQLRVLFDCQQLPLPENCALIWHQTADILLREPRTRAQACNMTACAVCEPVLHPASATAPCVSEVVWMHTLPLSPCLRTWQSWKPEAELLLEQMLAPESAVGVTVPVEFCPQRTDLYHVNRVLSGEETNESLWVSQLIRFLCVFCSERRLRLLLKTDCAVEKLSSILYTVSRQTVLPDLIWMPTEGGQWDDLVMLAEPVMASRGERRRGIPPVLLAAAASDGSSVPQFLHVCVHTAK